MSHPSNVSVALKIQSRQQNDICIVEIFGRIDPLNTNLFEEHLGAILKNQKILLKMNGIDYISSSGLGAFLTLLRNVKASNGELRICCMKRIIREIFEISGFVQLFDISETEEEALQKFSSRN
jgi:anti-sigma B factor antagonist